MRQPDNYNPQSESHGRGGGRLRAGTYIIRIDAVSEDQTGYGNQSLKLVYNIVEGEFAGFFDDISGNVEMDWRHTIEVDVEENSGGRLNALLSAVAASNPGFQWAWDERVLVGKFVGVTFQERLTTNKRGKRKGQTATYLDLWDFLPVEQVRAGQFEVPPVNDQRDLEAEAKAKASQEAAQTPVAVPQGFQQGQAPQAPAVAAPGGMAPQAPVVAAPQGFAPQAPAMAQPMQGYQQPQAGYQQPAQGFAPQGYAQQPMAQPQGQVDGVYSEDIPF